MADLGSAYVNIVPKAPGIEKNIGNLLGGAGDSAGRSAGLGIGKKLIAGIAAAGITKAVGSFIKDSFGAGGALEQSFGGLDTIYGDAAAAAKSYAMEAAQAGISANTYAEQAVSFGAALKAAYGGDTVSAVEAANTAILDMADNSAKMGTDISSVQAAYQGFAKQNYTMLDNLKLGYGGTKNEMERLLADAQKLSGVKYNIDNLGDVYNAIHVIQEDLGLTGVAAAEASTTLTGSMGAVKASWETVMGALTTGQGLETAMANLETAVGNFASNVLRMLSNLGPQLPGLVLGLADVIVAQSPEFLGAGVELILQLAVGLINAIPDLVAKLPEIFKAIFNAFAGVDWASLGSSLMDGIVSGVVQAATKLYNSVRDAVRGALNAGKAEAEVGSPSRLFARELGQWIPEGVAMGAEQNMSPLDRAMARMADVALLDARRATSAPSFASRSDGLASAIQELASRPVVTDVVLEGDAAKLFKVVRKTNTVRTTATRYNALAVGV